MIENYEPPKPHQKMNFLVIFVLIIFLSAVAFFPAHADTKLLGLHYGDPGSLPVCWVDGQSLNRYKPAKYQAEESGVIDYFKIHVSSEATVAGCASDTIVWIVFEGDANDTAPGDMKAYGVVTGYNWTSIGNNAYHTFPVTAVGTNRNITAGDYYWITYYSYGMNPDMYIQAGCSQQILIHRNTGNNGCTQPLLKRYCSDGACNLGECYEGSGEVGNIPDSSCFNTGNIASLYDLSVWSADAEADTTPPSAPSGLVVQ